MERDVIQQSLFPDRFGHKVLKFRTKRLFNMVARLLVDDHEESRAA